MYAIVYIIRNIITNPTFLKINALTNVIIILPINTIVAKLKKILNESGYILINALNEVLVQRFLKNKISFTDIIHKLLVILNSKFVRNYLKNHQIRHINDVFKVYNLSRSLVN